jgi:hypothetical protein
MHQASSVTDEEERTPEAPTNGKTKWNPLKQTSSRQWPNYGEPTGKAMIECKELANKVIGVFAIYEDGQYGPEVHIEFTDGTAFSACLQNQVSIEAKHIARHGDQLHVLKDYSTIAVPR